MLFDGVAQLYDSCRLGYPTELVEHLLTTAGLSDGSAILEVGCGTGQLTDQLARRHYDVTAIDIGPAMLAGARRRVGAGVRFRLSSFEQLTSADDSFDLVVSAAAFHWIDPEVRFDKAARLLRPRGWLAVLGCAERYDDPFGAALLDLWVARSDDRGAWLPEPGSTDADAFAASGLFEKSVVVSRAERLALPIEVVIGLENTRATSLSWPAEVTRRFTEELRRRLSSCVEVPLTRETSLTMARIRSRTQSP